MGLIYALSQPDRRGLLTRDDGFGEYLASRVDADRLATGDAWDAIHRALTDGYCRTDNGTYPLNLAIIGGQQLHDGDDAIVSYVSPSEVRDLAAALDEIDETEFADRYDFIDEDDYHRPLDNADLAATWAMFCQVRAFYRRAADLGDATVFIVDQ